VTKVDEIHTAECRFPNLPAPLGEYHYSVNFDYAGATAALFAAVLCVERRHGC